MVLDQEAEHPSRWAAVASIAAKIGWSPATLHGWVMEGSVAKNYFGVVRALTLDALMLQEP
ncbi:hypothetical protein CQ054_21615 [Ochrobactrum sp. MYb29]|nr:hypothetical protein CWE02_09710 [Brucella pituitosa]PRA79369.1 hypothetical protein CQ054_21615 [Ochrobactrum sp. MYb29]